MSTSAAQLPILWRRLIAVAIAFFALGAFYILYRNNPSVRGIFPPCPFLYLTGFFCPGCGALRSIHEILHFNLGRAFALNPLVVISLLPLAFYLGRATLSFGGFISVRAKPLPSFIYRLILAVVFLFWILRNLPWQPFSLLAPH